MWKILFFVILNIYFSSGIENRKKCFQDLEEVKNGVEKKEIWALKMFDSSAKIPNGILHGNVVNYGSFDECLSIHDKHKEIHGKYCQIKIFLSQHKMADLIQNEDKNIRGGLIKLMQANSYYQDGKLGLVLGMCFPKSCRASDLIQYYKQNTLNNELNENQLTISTEILQHTFSNNTTLDFTIDDKSCKIKEENTMEKTVVKGDWLIIILLCICLVLVIAGTLYEHSAYFLKAPGDGFFGRFSLIKNWRIIFQNKQNNNDYIRCIDGIRVLSMFWIVITYRIFYSVTFPIQNLKDFDTVINNPLSMLIINGNLGFDTFFVVSGILISYNLFKYINKRRIISLMYIGMYRYIRFTILFAFVILFYTTLLDNFSHGPNSLLIESSKEACLKNWWMNMLYIQNFAPFENICVEQSWYLAVDTQVFIASLLILLFITKWPKYTTYICWLFIIGSVIASFGITYSYELPGIINFGNYLNYYYKQTYTRYGPMLIGLLFGYYLQNINSKSKFHLNKLVVYLGWIISIVTLLCVIFAPFNIIDKVYNKLEHSVYNGLHRHAWSFAICWIIFACHTGYGGGVNKILSSYIFQVLSRLTYSIFLTFSAFQMILLTNLRTSQYFDAWNLIPTLLGECVAIIILSILISLLIELPLKIDGKSFMKYVERKGNTNNNLPANDNRKHTLNNLDIIDNISVISIN